MVKLLTKKLQKESEFNNISILGSIKNPNNKIVIDFTSRAGACLFAPEGVIDEVLMARFALKAANLMPKQLFVIRLHPVLSKAKVTKMIQNLGDIPKNFQLSEHTLSHDLERSNWVCYRGSTVVIQAILEGLRPIFLNLSENIKDNDPLPEDLQFKEGYTKRRNAN